MARSSLLLYGDTGTFKTTAVALAARYVFEQTGKGTLLFTASTDGWATVAEEVEAGLIQPFRCDANVPLPIIRRVSQGYWPDNADDAKMGAPIEKLNFVRMNFDDIGMVAFEGYTAASRSVMRHLADRGIKTGQEATSKFSQKIRVDGEIKDEEFASNSEGHYGFMANVLFSLTAQFQSLPIHLFMATAHDKAVEEKRTKRLILGPGTEGRITTPLLPTWFGDCIHAYKEPLPADENSDAKVEVRYYLWDHPDPYGVMYPAKPRVTHSQVGALRKAYAKGYFVPTPTQGIDGYLATLDKLTAGATDATLDKWRAARDAKLGRIPAKAVAAPATTTGK